MNATMIRANIVLTGISRRRDLRVDDTSHWFPASLLRNGVGVGGAFHSCIAHQKIPNEIKHLEETLGAFSLVQSNMDRVDCKS
jgi:hypothetical protein